MERVTYDTARAWLDDAADSGNEADMKAVAYITEYIKRLECWCDTNLTTWCRADTEEHVNATDDDGDGWDGGL